MFIKTILHLEKQINNSIIYYKSHAYQKFAFN